jgi:hypothetical protein
MANATCLGAPGCDRRCALSFSVLIIPGGDLRSDGCTRDHWWRSELARRPISKSSGAGNECTSARDVTRAAQYPAWSTMTHGLPGLPNRTANGRLSVSVTSKSTSYPASRMRAMIPFSASNGAYEFPAPSLLVSVHRGLVGYPSRAVKRSAQGGMVEYRKS